MAQTPSMRIFGTIPAAANLWTGKYSPLRQVYTGNV